MNKRAKKLEEIRENIGDELFYKLSLEDREFMADTAGSLDIGEVDLERMFKHIEDYKESLE